jgi:hypothetical protein
MAGGGGLGLAGEARGERQVTNGGDGGVDEATFLGAPAYTAQFG